MALFFVNLLGRWSDSCQSSYGRRRPYIFIISIILIISMMTLLSAHHIGKVLVGGGDTGRITTTTLLILGCAFLDFTYQICLTPCEALFSDLSQATDQEQSIFTVFSFMISFGGCIGYLITALDWSDFGLYFGSQENCVFIILILMFIFTMLITLHSAKEKPLGKLDKQNIIKFSKSDSQFYPDVPIHEFKAMADNSKLNDGWRYRLNNCQLVLLKVLFHITNFKNFILLNLSSVLPVVILQLFNIPHTLKQLALANLFSWAAINTFNLFYTDYIGRIIYQGNPYDEEGSIGQNSYDEGVRMASWGLFFHCIVSALYAPFINRIIRIFNLQATYFIGMSSFFVAMSLMTFSPNIFLTNLCASLTGIGYATVTTVPFLLLSSYHNHLELYFSDTHNGHHIPSRGIGTDLSVLDSAYFLSQVILSLSMGYIVKVSGTVMSYIVTSVILAAVSLYYISKIVHQPNQLVVLVDRTGKSSL